VRLTPSRQTTFRTGHNRSSVGTLETGKLTLGTAKKEEVELEQFDELISEPHLACCFSARDFKVRQWPEKKNLKDQMTNKGSPNSRASI